MQLKKITLNNIRSYENQEIEFCSGSTLLTGDIGSGKTSILLGIEFAFFGLQPGQKASSILRNGTDNGGVIIEFNIGENKIIIERRLKKSKTITQDYCSISINGEKKEISVMELKNKILELLNYPREFSKKQNILYKFTVYTPQEEMKQIILQDPQTRINTIRHVFGIDKYKKILENISIVISKVREEKRIKEGITKNFENEQMNILSKEQELESKSKELLILEKELQLKQQKRKKIQGEKQEISIKIQERDKLLQEIEKSNLMVSNKKDNLLINQKRIEQLDSQIKELGGLNKNITDIQQIQEDINLIKSQKEKLNQKYMEVNSLMNSIDLKISENEKLTKKLSNLEICPTCLQNVDAIYRANVLNKFHNDISKNNKTLEELELNKKDLILKIEKNKGDLDLKEKELGELNILKFKIQNSKEKQIQIKEIQNTNELLCKDIEILNKHRMDLKNSILDLNKFELIFNEKTKELDEAQRQERLYDIKFAQLKKEIEVFSMQIRELKERIKKVKQIKEKLVYLSGLENWLSKKFSTLISLVEKNVMNKLKFEFANLFSKWFSMLVSDSFNAKINNDFTPVIEYQDYEIDYSHLSGGERTAVALAYRLALNQIINSILSKIKTKNLIILDEPTDGFSEKQLDKIRDVLKELNAEQLIVVSHEQKIEGFVENVFKFKKEDGISTRE
jgi:exonuclease SbcC